MIANDERVFNGPGVNIPTISLSRSNFFGKGEWPYPEYHSSADTPAIVSEPRLQEAERVVIDILNVIEKNYTPVLQVRGPIFLSRYGLWVDWRTQRELNRRQAMVLEMLEGDRDLIGIAHELELDFYTVCHWLDKFLQHGLIEKSNHGCVPKQARRSKASSQN